VWAIGEIASLAVMGLAVVPRVERLALLGAGFSLAFGALMTAYVFGADTYTNDGRSRWATRGGGDHTLYLVTMAVATACAVVLALLAARGTRGWIVRPALLLGGAVDAVLGYLLVLGFDNN
jgi:hypothetical protein